MLYTRHSRRAFRWAATNGSAAVIQTTLEYVKDDDEHTTQLIHGSYALGDSSDDRDWKDRDGRYWYTFQSDHSGDHATALHIASAKGNDEVVPCLLDNEANTSAASLFCCECLYTYYPFDVEPFLLGIRAGRMH